MWLRHEVDGKGINDEIRKVGADIAKKISHTIEQNIDIWITKGQIMYLIDEYFLQCDGCGRALSPGQALEGEKEKRFGTKGEYHEHPIPIHITRMHEYDYVPHYCRHCARVKKIA